MRQRFGAANIQLLANLGLAETNACLAHCVWPEPHETDVLATGGATVVHCPSCNLKLGSGVAPIADYLEAGVNVALGADGAASNNRLDGWEELRLAALLARFRDGPTALAAREAFEIATLGGARALGLDADIGSIEPGKFADLADPGSARRARRRARTTCIRSSCIPRARGTCAPSWSAATCSSTTASSRASTSTRSSPRPPRSARRLLARAEPTDGLT